MVEKLSLDQALLEKNLAKARSELKKPRFVLYDTLTRREPSNVPTEEISASCASIEKLWGVYDTLKQTLDSNSYLSANFSTRERFVNLYAIYAGAIEAQHHISRYASDSGRTFVFTKKPDFSHGPFGVLNDLVNAYIENIKSVVGGKQVADYTKSFLSSLIKIVEGESKREEFSELNAQAREFFIQLDGVTINGFSYVLKSPQVTSLKKETFEDIVGNEDMIRVLKICMQNLILYDPRTKKNVKRDSFPKTFLFWGGTGTGKSATLRAALNYGLELAQKHSKPLFIRPLNSADFKTEFYSQSASNIKKLREEIEKGEAIIFSYSDDMDTVFFSRDELRNHPEDKSNLGTLMDMLDGVMTVDLGNFAYAAITNQPISGVDFALTRRLQENMYEVRGAQTPEQFAKLFKIKLRQGIQDGYIKVKEWEKLGRLCKEFGFHGGDVKNISRNVMNYALDSELPDKVFGNIPEEEKRKIIYSLMKPVDDSLLEQTIQRYCQDLEKQKEMEFRSAIEAEKKRMRIYNIALEEYQKENGRRR